MIGSLLLCLLLRLDAQHMDLSGPWEQSDSPDGGSSSITLPLGNRRLPEGLWLRRTVTVPEGATTLVLGRIPTQRVLLNGVEQPVRPAPGASTYRLPANGITLTIAIRLAAPPIPGPNQPVFDTGPYLLTTDSIAQAALREAAIDLQRRTQPYIFLAGCQLTLAIALALIWLRTERQYSALIWLALYMLYACHNLLRFSLLPDLPPSPRFLPAAISVQLALSIIGRDSRHMTTALWTAYAAFLAATSNHITMESARAAVGYTNASIHVLAILIMLGGAWYAQGRTRLVAIVGCCYWILLPIAVSLRQPLLLESPVGFWPILGLVNVPLTLTVVLLLTAQFAGDRRERIRLSAELEAARVVQQLLLPDATLNSGTLSVEAVYEPALEVGGDFYYIAEVESGAVLVVIGDVTGKGLRAAMVVSLLIGILRETRETSPAAILRRMNTGLLRKADAGFVTACCAVFHAGGAAAMATAGHPNPILDGAEIALPPALPLGCDPDADYSDVQTALPPASAVTFLSDGVIEAASASGELFGFERTLQVGRKPPKQIAAAARAWGQNDDITVVTVRSH